MLSWWCISPNPSTEKHIMQTWTGITLYTHTRKNINSIQSNLCLNAIITVVETWIGNCLYACQVNSNIDACTLHVALLTDKNWHPCIKCIFKDSGTVKLDIFVTELSTVYSELQIQGWTWLLIECKKGEAVLGWAWSHIVCAWLNRIRSALCNVAK